MIFVLYLDDINSKNVTNFVEILIYLLKIICNVNMLQEMSSLSILTKNSAMTPPIYLTNFF